MELRASQNSYSPTPLKLDIRGRKSDSFRQTQFRCDENSNTFAQFVFVTADRNSQRQAVRRHSSLLHIMRPAHTHTHTHTSWCRDVISLEIKSATEVGVRSQPNRPHPTASITAAARLERTGRRCCDGCGHLRVLTAGQIDFAWHGGRRY